jgi:LuxR family maltose regulon positive regulatory protein
MERLNTGLHRKLTLISAPAGFGKTTLLGAWVASLDRKAAWLSLDAGDSDAPGFLTYLVAAVQTVAPGIGAGVLEVLQSPQPPPPAPLLTALLNEITTLPDPVVLVLDDYHVLEAPAVDQALTFLLEHLPPQMHLVIATREDPQLPLARLRARGHLTELRAGDLRFTTSEAAGFLNQAMSLNLSADDITALADRTEGWIAGLQLAALSLQGHPNASRFIHSFTGSHHFVLDYLLEEVLQHQSTSIQTFLLRTSVLDQLCGPLCDAVLGDPAVSGAATLAYLEHANLFLVPLDDERHWYRYHQLFADLLRQRLQQSAASSLGAARDGPAELHRRASQWYEDQGLAIEAFHHAVAAHDVERAERLIEGTGVPLYFRGAGTPVRNWLESLPAAVLNARPALWVTYAAALLTTGQTTTVEQHLQAAEAALQDTALDDRSRDLVGRIASLRATAAVVQHDVATILAQSRRALEYLAPDNLPLRTAATWALGYAQQLQGDRAAARRAYADVLAISPAVGDSIYMIAATLCLGQVQEADTQLSLAAESYRRVLLLAGDPPQGIACEAHLGLARISYEWNDLQAAQQHGQQCLQLTRQIDSVDTGAAGRVVLARLRLAQGDLPGAVAVLAEAAEFVRAHNFGFRLPDVQAAQVLTLLRQGELAAAAQLAQTLALPLSQARVYLAQGAAAALAVLAPWREHVEARAWADERLKVLVLEALALQAQGAQDRAVQRLGEALALAEPGGFMRIFLDEGPPMAQLLAAAAAQRIRLNYIGKLRAGFAAEPPPSAATAERPPAAAALPLGELLSQRELEVLHLIAQGLSNQEISARLFLALSTVKGHNREIFAKLQVQRRTEAVARGRELGLL